MKTKQLFFTIALTLFCVVLAFTQSAKDLLSQGIAAEQRGDNIQALTFYIQAHTADKSLAEAENRMNEMLGIVADGKFGIDTNSDNVGVKSQNLIRLRNEWDKLLLAATELVASNPPLFEAYYFNDVTPQPMKEEDYNNNTMSFTVSAPYLRPFYAPENNEIIHILSATLKKIEEHDVWGAKINGFPNSYFADITGDNWLKMEKETSTFSVSLLDNRKKQLASKIVKYTIKYDKKNFPRISIQSDLNGKFDREYYVGSGEYISEGEIDKIFFNGVSMENVDSTSFSITAEYVGATSSLTTVKNAGEAELAIPISPAPADVAQLYSAAPKKHKKIVGNLSSRSYYDSNTWFRVVDQLESKFSSIDMSEAYGLYWIIEIIGTKNQVRSIVLPEGVETIYEKSLGKFKELESLTIPSSVTKIEPYMFDWEYRGIAEDSGEKLEVINYRGSERQWNTIEGHNNFGNVKINYLYEADKIKKEYTVVKEKVSVAREKAKEERLIAEKKAEEEARKAEADRIAYLEKHVSTDGLSFADAYEYIQRNANSNKLLMVKITGKLDYNDSIKILKLLKTVKCKVYLDLEGCYGIQKFYGSSNFPLHVYQLVGITFPSGTIDIGSSFFKETGIETIVIPTSVQEIDRSFLDGSKNLTKIIYKGTIHQWEKIRFYSHAPNFEKIVIVCKDAVYYRTYYNSHSYVSNTVFNSGTVVIDYTPSSNIAIPKSVTSISAEALKGVKNIYYEGSKKDWKKINFDYDKDAKALLKKIEIAYDRTDLWE